MQDAHSSARSRISALIDRIDSLTNGLPTTFSRVDLEPKASSHRHELNPVVHPRNRIPTLEEILYSRRVARSGGPTARRDIRESPEGHQSQAVQTFNHFPKLPKELRIKIYSLALPRATIVTSAANSLLRKNTWNDCRYYKHREEFEKRVPAILHVCKESRYEFMAKDGTVSSHPVYKLCKVVDARNIRRGLYVCLENDTWVVGQNTVSMFSVELHPIRHLAVEITGHDHDRNWGHFWDNLYRFKSLDLITIFCCGIKFYRGEGPATEDGIGPLNVLGLELQEFNVRQSIDALRAQYPEWRVPRVVFTEGKWPVTGSWEIKL